ncbi:hypothetical protein T265_03089 [Opisthorchis viverrini]|uniref:Uncharacterized protein n=1 Tax=Opisthorchis viverrini TaxID=6198 RepID=A0A074ZSS7_OPIVI|nr:hypothetical protein T265_03089 [Opisthorchis viverrini]KER30478.1 hypothetical protein T265_03089 [Opisthorchis viverrini]
MYAPYSSLKQKIFIHTNLMTYKYFHQRRFLGIIFTATSRLSLVALRDSNKSRKTNTYKLSATSWCELCKEAGTAVVLIGSDFPKQFLLVGPNRLADLEKHIAISFG